ncbi:MAG: S8 family serine peptidase [Lachnospiraceae bacterium]|nr:S8 family serine peptidase [Lachnospiraceae bacterium]
MAFLLRIVIVISIILFIIIVIAFIKEKYIYFTQVTTKTVKSIHSFHNYSGNNVNIAILDSGVDKSHDDFGQNIKKGYNFVKNNFNSEDINGHGTQVTGVISAKDNSFGIKGIAPKAKIYPIVVLNNQSKGKIDDICKGIEWCIDNKMDIINLSFSTSKDDLNLRRVIKKANQKGIIIIASYNNRNKIHSFPAEYKEVFGVRSNVNKDNIFLKKDIVYAPGKGILTTNLNNRYVFVSGNSIACAYVTGVVALLKEKYCLTKTAFNKENIKNEFERGLYEKN